MKNRPTTKTQIEVSDLRAGLRETLDEVLESGRRLVVTRHGREIAALVPLGDLRALEAKDASAVSVLEAGAERVELEPGKGMTVEEALASSYPPARRARGELRVSGFSPAPEVDMRLRHGALLQEIQMTTADIDVNDPERSIESLRRAVRDLARMVQESEKQQGNVMVSALLRTAELMQRAEGSVDSNVESDIRRIDALDSQS